MAIKSLYWQTKVSVRVNGKQFGVLLVFGCVSRSEDAKLVGCFHEVIYFC